MTADDVAKGDVVIGVIGAISWLQSDADVARGGCRERRMRLR